MDGIKQALLPGRPWPLGASWDGKGINFAVFSAHAQALELCLFDDTGTLESSRLMLPAHTDDVWHAYLPGAMPGLIYGLRAHGPWRPDRGHLFNPHKLLLDPYAREIVGDFEWRDEHFGADRRHPLHMDTGDNAAIALKAQVVHGQLVPIGYMALTSAYAVLYVTMLLTMATFVFSRRDFK